MHPQRIQATELGQQRYLNSLLLRFVDGVCDCNVMPVMIMAAIILAPRKGSTPDEICPNSTPAGQSAHSAAPL